MDNRPIGIFDSGVGGLSVLLEIKKLLPDEAFIFIADQSFVPYGGKTKEELVDRVYKIIDFLQKKNVKAIVAACNTATVYTIDEMRQKFDGPVIGTVPVVKTLATISKTRKAAVFSTPATAKSSYLDFLIKKFAPDMEIIKVGGSDLEELIEEGELDLPAIETVLQTELPPLVLQGVDAIALSCTHYPFLRSRIEIIVGPGVAVVDSGGAVARQLQKVLINTNSFAQQKTDDEYYTTADENRFQRAAEKLMKIRIGKAAHIDF